MNVAADREMGEGWVVSSDVLVSHLEGEAVLLDLESKKYFRLNETSAVIWKGLVKGCVEGELAQDLSRAFDVDEAEAHRSVRAHLEELEQRGLVRRAAPDEGEGAAS